MTNFKRHFYIFLLAAVLTVIFAPKDALSAERFLKQKGEGIAQTYDNEAEARRLALKDAIKNSVVEAVKTFIPDSVVEEQREKLEKEIFSRADIYVASYKVIYRGWITRLDILVKVDKDGEPIVDEDGDLVVTEGFSDEVDSMNDAGESQAAAETIDALDDMAAQELEEAMIADEQTDLDLTGIDGEEEEGPDQSYLFRDDYKQGIDEYHLGVDAKIFIRQLKEDVLKLTGIIEDEDLRVVNILIVEIADYMMFQNIVDSLESLEMVRDLDYKSFEYERINLDIRIAEKTKKFQKQLRETVGEEYSIIIGDEDLVIIKPSI